MLTSTNTRVLPENVLSVLVCPSCHGELEESDYTISCLDCCASFVLSQEGVPVLHSLSAFDDEVKSVASSSEEVTAGVNLENTSSGVLLSQGKSESAFSRLRTYIKRNSWLLGPSIALDRGKGKRFASLCSRWQGVDRITLNIGSRGQNLWEGMIATDVYPTNGVSLSCDAHCLPFEDSSVDCIIATSLFEHLRKPRKAAQEVERVLKSGGEAYIEVPWMYEVHGVPLDFQRWTLAGLEELFSDLLMVDKGVSEGPVCTWARMTRQCAASFFSNKYLHYGVRVLFTWLLFWVKYLDCLIPEKNRVHMAMGYYILLKKK
jgi:SAM-dependent methyltransferase